MKTEEQKQGARPLALPSGAVLARKRAFDVVCSALGLLVISPVLLVCALVVALTSPGGVLFRQERIGKGEKPFTIYKFRTMYSDSHGLPLTTSNDRRVTPVGRVLRKTKLDELPQLWNVLRGDMSLVGPRPEVREYTALYTQEQRQVFLVRPGITSIASIRFRNESELLDPSDDPHRTYVEEIMPQELALDLEYIPQASVCTDIRLILQTLAAIVGS